MPISNQTEDSLASRINTKYKQNKATPFLINIKDGRLIPNNVNTAMELDYRPYHGDVKISRLERLKNLQGVPANSRTRLINSMPDVDPTTFDLGKATKLEIIAFAMDEYALPLSEETDVRTLRKQVQAAAERADAELT